MTAPITPVGQGVAILKAILVGLVAALVVFAGYQAYLAWNEYQSLKEFKAQADAIGTATTAGIDEMGTQQAAQATQEAAVYDRRGRLDRDFEELKRNDQDVAAWAATPIPERLRALEREAGEGEAAGSPGIDGPSDSSGRRGRAGDAADDPGSDQAPR